MWYTPNTLLPRSSALQKENLQTQFFPRYMSPVSLFPQELKAKAPKLSPSFLTDYASALHSFSNLSLFLDFSLDSVLAVVDAHVGSLFIWDEYAKELVLKSARGLAPNQVRNSRIKLRDGIAGWIADKGFAILVEDVRTDNRFSGFKKYHSYRSFSFLSLPLIVNNKLLGLINITERENARPFNENDLEFASVFIKHIALAYKNMRTEIRLREENETLNKTLSDLKESVRQQEAFVFIGKLASNVAHELTNPLDAIRRFVNLALDQLPEDGLAREYMLNAKKGIRRSIQVIRGLLELSGAVSKNRSRQAELHQILNKVISSLFEDPAFEQIKLEQKFCQAQLIVNDHGLQTVFQNLFQNANHAMHGSGTISVTTEERENRAVVVIHDSGSGIPEHIRNRIFEPFFTTKENGNGTGVGLTICREIVQRSGGNISVENDTQKGARFIITLPCQN